MRKELFVFLVVMLLATFTSSSQVSKAEEPRGENPLNSSIEFSYLYPSSEGLDFLSGIYTLGFNGKVGPKTRLGIKIPILAIFTDNDSESAVGNLYTGIEHNFKNGLLEAGLFVPTLSSDDRFLGVINSYFDVGNMPSYLAGATSLRIFLSYLNISENKMYLKIGGGPDIIIKTGDKSALSDDMELIFNYKAVIGYQNDMIHFSIGTTGIFAVSEEFDDFADRFMNIADFNFKYIGSDFQPYMLIRLPLEEPANELYDLSLTFGISIFLK